MALLASCRGKTSSTPSKDITDKVTEVSVEDVEMNQAMAKARATFNQFDTAFRNGHFDPRGFLIKVRFDIQDGSGEHIWTGDLSIDNGNYIGTIYENAIYIDSLKAGYK